MIKCLKCKYAALYQEPGFTGTERSYCTVKHKYRNGCKHGVKGKPRRAVLNFYIDISPNAAVWGYEEVD